MRNYTLIAADGSTYASSTRGEYGGNRKQRVFGTMDCGVARDQLRRHRDAMLAHRVFFADEAAAVAAGYRPCGSCQRPKYLAWKAQGLATEWHEGQVDKAGRPYITHPARVAARAALHGPDAEAAAWLHDVVEDCGVSAADLTANGFPQRIVEAVLALTKRPGEQHEAAVRRACDDPVARIVKAADVADNADSERLVRLDPALRERLGAKYAHARAVLDEHDAPRF